MSLYHEASAILANEDKRGGSLKSRIFSAQNLKSPPVKIYALMIESLKWSQHLKDVIERSELLKFERKVDPPLSVLLVHDLLLSKGGIAAPLKHPLRVAVEKHKTRLSAEFTKCRIRHGFSSLDAFRKHVDGGSRGNGNEEQFQHPRWVRVNTIKRSQDMIMRRTFVDFAERDQLSDVLGAGRLEKVVHRDVNIPDLLAIPHGFDVARMSGYNEGDLILQDKASCFPAYLLDPAQCGGDIIDSCAAPGNKTTHLAALLHSSSSPQRKVFAFERDKPRTLVLKKMVAKATAEHIITVFGNTDFLSIDPKDSRFANVGALLLDPSCSGTGIVGRDDEPQMHLPEPLSSKSSEPNPKKRKRNDKPPPVKARAPEEVAEVDSPDEEESSLSERLRTLSAFQLKLLEHAMKFPKATRITYSTCSIHAEENEAVVVKALASDIARGTGWRIMLWKEQPEGLKKWPIRGSKEDCEDVMEGVQSVRIGNSAEEVADACIRCEKGTKEGTMGFFVAGFVRDLDYTERVEGFGGGTGSNDEEWAGFSDNEDVR